MWSRTLGKPLLLQCVLRVTKICFQKHISCFASETMIHSTANVQASVVKATYLNSIRDVRDLLLQMGAMIRCEEFQMVMGAERLHTKRNYKFTQATFTV